MSSNTAVSFSVPRHAVYSASKAAINAAVRVLSKDCGKKKITINAIAPGGTVTDMFHETAKDYLPNAENLTKEEILNVRELLFLFTNAVATTKETRTDPLINQIVANVSPLKRCGYPDDIAKVVGFLASEESEWVNGKVIEIDGGAA